MSVKYRSGMIVVPHPRATYLKWTRAKLIGPYEHNDSGYTVDGMWRAKIEGSPKGTRTIVNEAHILPAVRDGEAMVDW